MPDYPGPLPIPTPESRPFWEAARRHELSLPRCRACGRFHYFPRAACPFCLSPDLAWQRASGRGTLYTFTVVHRGLRGFPLGPPYVLAVVELAEGPRMMTNLVGIAPDPAQIRIGMPVEVAFEDVTREVALPRFRPAEPTA
ncbi:MAG TPA: Zn-ribbon domain-containing OB-fold protein [Candidatus Binatia bacterium]|nr:Zn-ribbon domain-containing OB-fold protein [Candidatus Binatia bacterium]